MKWFIIAVFSLAFSSDLWSDAPEQSFSDRVSSELSPVVATLSPEQARQLIPVFQLYETELARLSESLRKEREARDFQSTVEALGVGAGGLVIGALTVEIFHGLGWLK